MAGVTFSPITFFNYTIVRWPGPTALAQPVPAGLRARAELCQALTLNELGPGRKGS